MAIDVDNQQLIINHLSFASRFQAIIEIINNW